MSHHTDPGALLKLADEIDQNSLRIIGADERFLSSEEQVVIVKLLRQAASHGREGGEAVAWRYRFVTSVDGKEWSDWFIVDDPKSIPSREGQTVQPLYATVAQASPRSTEITKEMALAGRKALALVADRMEEAKLLATSSIDFWQRVGHEPANEIYAAMVETSVVPSAHQSAPSDSSSLPSGESDPSATTDFLGAGTGDNAAPYGNSPREIQKRAMKARTSAISTGDRQ